ncbi:hypothetical protein CERSUDRAFT_65209 [Gelatoporia subvermispora B]|uniref:HAT C-terminal dimerisation domain-containing protein n=1 Tax=Ceriporiopsis subvermispora (strain B) TaxID=914234 RepID=M2RFI3_CERS8|nr:hypothetical protein CERSUDRAFT_65209 [Gelatoporia subvermispora B]
MKVRWSSTYMMLDRAYSLRKYVVPFLHELARSEDSSEVQRKLYQLIPSKVEWERVKLFQRVLKTADECQQRFSSENNPALHLALPALEEVHASWTNQSEDPKYAHFKPGLQAGLHKIEQYYERIADNDAYIMFMVLDPQRKLTHIKENWTEKLHDEALAVVQKLFRERYYQIYPKSNVRAVSVISRTGSSSCVNRTRAAALAELSSDEEESDGALRPVQPMNMLSDEVAAEQACERAFRKYLELDDGVPEGMEILNGHHYPVWASLARDYLAIMATSVSSERAFSSAGITITKRRNRLKGDIVEALQLLKSALRKSLFLFKCGPSSATESVLVDTKDGEDIIPNIQKGTDNVDDESEFELVVDLNSDAEDIEVLDD